MKNSNIQLKADMEFKQLLDKLALQETKCVELEKSLRAEQATLQEKSIKYQELEQKLIDFEKRHHKELKFMQREIKRIKESEDNLNAHFHNISTGEHLNTYTHRKGVQGEQIEKQNSQNRTPISINYKSITQSSNKTNVVNQQLNYKKHFQGHHKGISISSGSMNNNITLPGSQSTKKTNNGVKKIATDMQKNIIKGLVLNKTDHDNNGVILELSNRSPDKSNPEMSPYMMEFYNKKSKFYDETFASKNRSSSGCIKPISKANIEQKNEDQCSPTRSEDSTTHK